MKFTIEIDHSCIGNYTSPMDPIPDTQCMVYLPTFTPKITPNVGKYASPIECLGMYSEKKTGPSFDRKRKTQKHTYLAPPVAPPRSQKKNVFPKDPFVCPKKGIGPPIILLWGWD